jgi:hypothetical protein
MVAPGILVAFRATKTASADGQAYRPLCEKLLNLQAFVRPAWNPREPGAARFNAP